MWFTWNKLNEFLHNLTFYFQYNIYIIRRYIHLFSNVSSFFINSIYCFFWSKLFLDKCFTSHHLHKQRYQKGTKQRRTSTAATNERYPFVVLSVSVLHPFNFSWGQTIFSNNCLKSSSVHFLPIDQIIPALNNAISDNIHMIHPISLYN